MKVTTPAHAAPGSWSAGMIRSQIASSVRASSSLRQRQGVLEPRHATMGPAAVATAVICMNFRRLNFALWLIRQKT